MLKRIFTVGSIITLLMISNISCSVNDNQEEKKINELLQQMTLEEKIGLLHGNAKFSNGGIPRLGIPAFRMSDGPCGVRMEVNKDDWGSPNWENDKVAYFPALTALAATWDMELARAYGKALGEESRARGKHIQLAPGINIHRSPLCGRNWEYLSEDPYLISKLVVPIIKGMQSTGVAACVKHYALNNQEYLRDSINVECSERALREIYLPGFEAAVKEGEVLTVMGAYNKFRGQYASHNDYLINEILRNEWGFKGIVISDWNATRNTLQAAENGLDIEMGTNVDSYSKYYMSDPLLNAVKSGKVDVKLIDEKVKRILYVMMKLNILNEKPFDTTGMAANLVTPERVAVSRKIAEESVVLLKNDGILPLDISNIKSIAVIGDNATRGHSLGGGSTIIKAKYEVAPLDGIKNKFGKKVTINYARGYKTAYFQWTPDTTLNLFDEALMKEAVSVAKKSDVVLFFGGLNHNYGCDTEGADKPNMTLPYGQDKLIDAILKANPKTIIVMLSGSPVDMMQWVDKVPAILHNSYIGMEGGNAIADVIAGDVNPSGKLATTFPKKLSDSPAHSVGEFPGSNGTVNYKEGIFVGYRYFDTKNIEPLFPFGYGLSYTTYEYSGLKLPEQFEDDSIIVSFDVKNSGKFSGKEIAQVYIKDEEPSVEKADKELKGYAKVSLEAGESKTVSVTIYKKDLGYYDEQRRDWIIDPGKYQILVGASSRDIKLSGKVELE